MKNKINIFCNKATEATIFDHLEDCDDSFYPKLSSRVTISEYASKIYNNALRFEAWQNDLLVGLLACYCNNAKNKSAYITNLSVLNEFMKKGIASELVAECRRHISKLNYKKIIIEVDSNNTNAIRFYKKMKFITKDINQSIIVMDSEFLGEDK